MTDQDVRPRKTSISNAASDQEAGEFWDSHDFTDYEADCPDVTDQFVFEIQSTRHVVAMDPEVLDEAATLARKRGISTETFVNLAVRDALDRVSPKATGKRKRAVMTGDRTSRTHVS